MTGIKLDSKNLVISDIGVSIQEAGDCTWYLLMHTENLIT